MTIPFAKANELPEVYFSHHTLKETTNYPCRPYYFSSSFLNLILGVYTIFGFFERNRPYAGGYFSPMGQLLVGRVKEYRLADLTFERKIGYNGCSFDV